MHHLLRLLVSARPQFWAISIGPALSGLLLSDPRPTAYRVLLVTLCVAAGSALAELANDLIDRHDDASQIAKRIGPFVLSGGSGVTSLGGIDKTHVIIASSSALLLVAITSMCLGFQVGIAAALGIVLAVGYSLPPLNFKCRGLFGPITVALGRGLVSFHIGWLTAHSMSMISLTVSALLSFLTLIPAILALLADREEDQALGISTFPVVAGFGKTRRVLIIALSLTVLSGAVALGQGVIGLNFLAIPVALGLSTLLLILLHLTPQMPRLIQAGQLIGMLLVASAGLMFTHPPLG